MIRKLFSLMTALVLLFGLLPVGPAVRPAYAAGYVVNSLLDNTTNDSACTLREAILAANNDATYNGNCGAASNADDTITFGVSGIITLTTALPNIVSGQGALTIDGGGQSITISGGGSVQVMFVNSGADLTLRNLTIANGNAGSASGGGIYNDGTLTVVNSTFSGNAAGGGGGIANTGTLTVTGSTFSGNGASLGGGIWNTGALTVTNSTFSGNSAILFGGGIANSGTLTVTNSTFSGNSANFGGGIQNGGTLTVTNSTFSGNSAILFGGGIANSGTLTVTNSTFSGNSANFGSGGGGLYVSGGTATLKNTIVANSTNGDCVGSLSGTNNNNLIESTGAGACGLTNGMNGNIIGQDPNLGALTGNPAYFPLNPGSPAMDAGDNATCAATDQRGVTRPQDGNGDNTAICDIGAYERTLQPQSYIVNTTNDNITDDTFCTLREAILAANDAPANGNCGVGGAGADTITFSVSGVITLTLGTLPNIVSASTAGKLTIDGTGQSITISGGGSVRVMIVDSGADLTLRNLTIANGNAGSAGGGGIANSGTLTVTNSTFSGNSAPGAEGGGIRNGGTLTVTNSTFSGNSAGYYGGGIRNYGTLTVVNSTFSGNSAANFGGGGIHNDGTLTVTNSTFSGNSAGYSGGGIRNTGTLTVTNSTFSGNSAGYYGGGIRNTGTLTVTNSTFSGNSAGYYGGGIDNTGTLTVTNSTFSGNSAGYYGGGIANAGTLTVTNSTLSGNSANFGGGIYNDGTATLQNTIIANSASGGDCVGSLSGTNNNNLIESTGAAACSLTHGSSGNIIGQDPNLGSLTGNPAYFPLNPGSPAIDAGDNATCAATDQRGVTRPQDGDVNGTAVCDIGAYEREPYKLYLPYISR